MRTAILLVLALLAWDAEAWTVISDPWPVGPQPDSCVATESGQPNRSIDLIAAPDGRKSIREDISDIADGQHSWSIVCSSATPGITPSPPAVFGFATGQLGGPSGMRLAP